jgi:hypothetical protein
MDREGCQEGESEVGSVGQVYMKLDRGYSGVDFLGFIGARAGDWG